jgi:hypothetical protein
MKKDLYFVYFGNNNNLIIEFEKNWNVWENNNNVDAERNDGSIITGLHWDKKDFDRLYGENIKTIMLEKLKQLSEIELPKQINDVNISIARIKSISDWLKENENE